MIQIKGDAQSKNKTAKVTDANDQPERDLAHFRLEAAETGNVDDDGEVETVSIISRAELAATTGEIKLSDRHQAALHELFKYISDGEVAARPNDVHVPPNAKGTTLDVWRNRLRARAIIKLEAKNPYEDFARIHRRLIGARKIAIWQRFVYPIE